MTKWTKVVFLLALYYGVLAFEACESVITDCNCPTVELPFFDYGAILAGLNTTSVPTTQGSYLEIIIQPDEVELVAQQKIPCSPGMGLLSRAYACSCAPPGGEGDKFRIVAINVFADRPFRDGLTAEDDLNAFFKIPVQGDVNSGEILQPIEEVAAFPRFGWRDNTLSIFTDEVPDITGTEEPYRFTVEIEKENGEQLSAQTIAVFWE